jgi:hypothetical protein
MAIVSIGVLLDRASKFEEQLVKYYAAIRDESQNDGVKLLTYYLSRHRRHLKEVLNDFSREEIERIRRIQLKHDIKFHSKRHHQGNVLSALLHLMITPPRDVKGKELLEAAVGYDAELIELYKGILQQPLSREATTFVESLIRVEERDIVMLKKMLAMDYF